VVQPPDHLKVLPPREVLVDRGVLSGQPDARAQLAGLPHDVEAGDLRPPGVGLEERGEDTDRGRLAGAVRPQETKDRPLLDLQVETIERAGLAVALLQTFGQYGGSAVCHAVPFGVGARRCYVCNPKARGLRHQPRHLARPSDALG
jgi:hypothetical protein